MAERTAKGAGDISDDMAKRHIRLIKAKLVEVDQAKAKVRSKSSELRELRKTAKGDGLDVDALNRALMIEETPVGEVIQTERNTGRYLRLMEVKIGHQWSMFDEGEEKVPTLDAYAQGERDGKNGVSRDQNGFDPGSDNYVQYDTGWIAGQAALLGTPPPA